MTTHTIRVGTEVFLLALRPEPLLHLIGMGGPIPFKVCKSLIKGIATGGGFVQVDDEELAPALGDTPVGHVVTPFTGIFIDRARAVHLGCDEILTLVTGPLAVVIADYPDLGAAVRRRWDAFTSGELLDEADLARGREVGLC